jgi:hypothetical protein
MNAPRTHHGTRQGIQADTECFRMADAFMKRCPEIDDLPTLASEFGRSIRQIGYRYFACGSHADPLHENTPIMLLNYPAAWVATYSERRLHLIDPVFKRANESSLPFPWDEPTFIALLDDEQREMIELARDFGIAHGYTIPLYCPKLPHITRASCSLIPDVRSLPHYSRFAAQAMAIHLFEAATRIVICSRSARVNSILTSSQVFALFGAAEESHAAEIKRIVSAVLVFTGVDSDELFSRSHRHQVVLARAVIAWQVRERNLATLRRVAEAFCCGASNLSMSISSHRRTHLELFRRDLFHPL